MNIILQIIINTPLWVWIVLLLQIYLGYKAFFTRVVSSQRLFLIPAIVIYMQLESNRNIFFGYVDHIVIFNLLGLCIGVICGLLIAYKTKISADKYKHLLLLPGTYFTLVILILNFSFQYTLHVWFAINKAAIHNNSAVLIIIIGLFSGLILGRNSVYLIKFMFAEHTNLDKKTITNKIR